MVEKVNGHAPVQGSSNVPKGDVPREFVEALNGAALVTAPIFRRTAGAASEELTKENITKKMGNPKTVAKTSIAAAKAVLQNPAWNTRVVPFF